MHEKAYSTWYCSGVEARQRHCRSPGIDPAALMTTSFGPISSFSAPNTSVCAGSGVWSR